MSYYPPGNAWQTPGMGPGGGYEEFGAQPGMQRPAAGPSGSSPFNNMFSGATSAMAQHGLAAYGGKFLGSGREYVQSNISKLGNMHYYFQVNSQYVKNKLKILLFPFLHKGHWTRIAEQVGGDKLTYKPPNEDINAPDLYLPFMAFGTYMILCGIFLGMKGQFGPEVLSSRCTRGLVAWGAQILLMRSILYTLGSGNSPLLDIIAYTGYSFVGVSINILARMGSLWVYYGVLAWTTISLDVFLVRTLKRILFAEARSYDRDSSRHHYMLLLIALFQFPVAIGLGLL